MTKQKILIIESRSALDIYDERCEGNTLRQVLELQGVAAKCTEVINKGMLLKALKIAQREHIKYVHISAHGSSDGFTLTDGDSISWKDFDKIAWPILKGKCICFSSCSVGRGAEQLFDFHKSFCNAIVGPTRDITWGEGLVAYSAFYHRAQSYEKSSFQDVRVMNNIVGAGTFRFIVSPYISSTYTIDGSLKQGC
ncbi:hypothetical protein F8538_00165 [Edwardsiella ictaluri]|uniref:hypothetical protein n=1 Tax=Edwardsiella ictaluri TaxID=67780 RepID=UPI0009BF47B4|nr:hypothetical protein [Edwardsiella ictaluri]ARD39896.1 hypothetical protein B6E78_11360 [Edwardsiella ictaluri]QPW25442.1 hypothetical protein F8538_00165 [Edwardsiella ictaluri]